MTDDHRNTSSPAGENDPVVIRKYANRRLYNTASGEFVKLDDLKNMVASGEAFVVMDGKSGEDITSSILAQIIADQEARGSGMLPDALLRQIIGMYGKGVPANFSKYIENSMEVYNDNWEQFENLGEIGRQNMEVFQKTFASLFGAGRSPEPEQPDVKDEGEPAEEKTPSDEFGDQVNDLREQLRAMQEKLDNLTKGQTNE